MYSNRLKNIHVKKVSVVEKLKLKILKWYNDANPQNKNYSFIEVIKIFQVGQNWSW